MEDTYLEFYHGKIAGISFRRQALDKLVTFLQGLVKNNEDFEVRAELRHDPNNKYDANAIEVHVGVDDALFFVGFIPKTHNSQIIEHGIDKVEVKVEKFNKDLEDIIRGINIVVVSKDNSGDDTDHG